LVTYYKCNTKIKLVAGVQYEDLFIDSTTAEDRRLQFDLRRLAWNCYR